MKILKLFLKNQENIGYISFSEPFCENIENIENIENNKVSLQFLFVDEKYRGKGYGIYLLWCFYDYITKNYKKVKYVEADDCSDRFNHSDNIYKKVGFNYLYDNQPEMIWNLYEKNVLKIYKKIKQLNLDQSVTVEVL